MLTASWASQRAGLVIGRRGRDGADLGLCQDVRIARPGGADQRIVNVQGELLAIGHGPIVLRRTPALARLICPICGEFAGSGGLPCGGG